MRPHLTWGHRSVTRRCPAAPRMTRMLERTPGGGGPGEGKRLRTPCAGRADPRPRPPAHTCRPLPQRHDHATTLRPRLAPSPRPGHVSVRPQAPVSRVPVPDMPGGYCSSRLLGKPGAGHVPPATWSAWSAWSASSASWVARTPQAAVFPGRWTGLPGPKAACRTAEQHRGPRGSPRPSWGSFAAGGEEPLLRLAVRTGLPGPREQPPQSLLGRLFLPGRSRSAHRGVRPRQRSILWPPHFPFLRPCPQSTCSGRGRDSGQAGPSGPRPSFWPHGDIALPSLVASPPCRVVLGLALLLTRPPSCEEGLGVSSAPSDKLTLVPFHVKGPGRGATCPGVRQDSTAHTTVPRVCGTVTSVRWSVPTGAASSARLCRVVGVRPPVLLGNWGALQGPPRICPGVGHHKQDPDDCWPGTPKCCLRGSPRARPPWGTVCSSPQATATNCLTRHLLLAVPEAGRPRSR